MVLLAKALAPGLLEGVSLLFLLFCNRFGESLLHLACRKALVKVVEFLVNEVEVPVREKYDIGPNATA